MRIIALAQVSLVAIFMGVLSMDVLAKVDFKAQIFPILENSCIKSCHMAAFKDKRGKLKKPKAGLRLDGAEFIMKGSKDGEVVIPHKPADSSMYTLISLPPDDDDIMPAKGDPLTKKQQAIIKAWIEEGADFGGWQGQKMSAAEKKKATNPALPPKYTPVKHYLDILGKGVTRAPASAVTKVRKTGLYITTLSTKNHLIRVEYLTKDKAFGDSEMATLVGVKRNVAELILSRTAVSDKGLKYLVGFTRLTHLNLSETKVRGPGLVHLKTVKNLRYLNLYGTDVDNSSLKYLMLLKNLNAIYLQGTKVTESGVKSLKRSLPKAFISYTTSVDLPTGGKKRDDSTGRGKKKKKK